MDNVQMKESVSLSSTGKLEAVENILAAPPLLSPEDEMRNNARYENAEFVNENVEGREDNEGLIKITIMEEGHLRLVDSANRSYFFSADELRRRNIDANALTDENIHEIIQLAMPQLMTDNKADAEPLLKKRRFVDPSEHSNKPQSSGDSYCHHSSVHSGYSGSAGTYRSPSPAIAAPQSSLQPKVLTSTNFSYFRATSLAGAPPAGTDLRDHPNATISDVGIGGLGRVMIGEQMEVKNAEGRIETAIVRYYRPGTGYKIQFLDGHFEWLEENSVLEMKHQQSSSNSYAKTQQNHPPSSGKISGRSFHRIPSGHPSHHNNSFGPSSQQFRRYSQPYQSTSASEIVHSAPHQHQPHGSATATTLSSPTPSSTVKATMPVMDNSVVVIDDGDVMQKPQIITHHPTTARYSSQSAYRDNAVQPNMMGMRVTLNEDHMYQDYGTNQPQNGNYHYHHQRPQNLHDTEIVEMSNSQLTSTVDGNMATIIMDDGVGASSGEAGIADEIAYQNPDEDNFFCAACDRHCPQEQLSYIVVRIPACVGCAGSKVIILDDEEEQNGVGQQEEIIGYDQEVMNNGMTSGYATENIAYANDKQRMPTVIDDKSNKNGDEKIVVSKSHPHNEHTYDSRNGQPKTIEQTIGNSFQRENPSTASNREAGANGCAEYDSITARMDLLDQNLNGGKNTDNSSKAQRSELGSEEA